MRQVRNMVFETNSSSTHSICIPKKTTHNMDFVRFSVGEYGWENRCVYDTASYLYTAILDGYDYDEAMEKIEKLKSILDSRNIEYAFRTPEWREYDDGTKYLDNGYVDHAYDAHEFVEAVLNDEDMLIRYLIDGCVYTGNDNQDTDFERCDIAITSQTVYDFETKTWVEEANPYHDAENYTYFYKGN